MEEIWKNVPGFEGILVVSDFGRVRSVCRKINHPRGNDVETKGKLLAVHQNKFGYSTVHTSVNGKQYTRTIHRLVSLAFLEKVEGKEFVNHINGIKTDNRLENLEWCTKSENSKHAFTIGLRCTKGDQHPQHKVTEKQVLEIRAKYVPKKYSSLMLAKEYNISKITVYKIVYRRSWKHI